VTKFMGAAARALRGRSMNGICSTAPVAIAWCKKLRLDDARLMASPRAP
jgi:hypothetical protein